MELLRNILNQLGVNSSFFYQFALVVIVYMILSRAIFKPLLAILVTRREKTAGKKLKADELAAQTEKIQADYNRMWMELEDKAFAKRDEIHAEAAKEVKSILRQAYDEADSYISGQKSIIEKNMHGAETELDKYIPGLAENVRDALIER
ncbi:MAG: hypothetical protein JXA66_06190 [Oligoflexia bacterium]|nr:hypothetical protein [Oligoflexia bacterium]